MFKSLKSMVTGKEPSANKKESLKELKKQHDTLSEIQKQQNQIMKDHATKMGELNKKRAETVKNHKEYLEKRRQTAKKHATYLDEITPAKSHHVNKSRSKSPKKRNSLDELALIDAFENEKPKSMSPASKLMREMMLIEEFDSSPKKSKTRSPKKGGKTMKKRGKK